MTVKPSGRSGYENYAKMKRKKCSKCRLDRSINQFYNKAESKDGKSYICIACKKMKDYYIGKTIKRPCLGVNCRGKLFKSFNGARVCASCRSAIKGLSDNYNEQIIIMGKSKRVR